MLLLAQVYLAISLILCIAFHKLSLLLVFQSSFLSLLVSWSSFFLLLRGMFPLEILKFELEVAQNYSLPILWEFYPWAQCAVGCFIWKLPGLPNSTLFNLIPENSVQLSVRMQTFTLYPCDK